MPATERQHRTRRYGTGRKAAEEDRDRTRKPGKSKASMGQNPRENRRPKASQERASGSPRGNATQTRDLAEIPGKRATMAGSVQGRGVKTPGSHAKGALSAWPVYRSGETSRPARPQKPREQRAVPGNAGIAGKRDANEASRNGGMYRTPRETSVKFVKPEPGNAMQDIRPTVWIGKSGMTPTVIQEIIGQLATRDLIKVKWLRNIGVEPAAIAEKTGSILISVRGRTMVLARRKRPADRGR
jgi:RNA-binding protein